MQNMKPFLEILAERAGAGQWQQFEQDSLDSIRAQLPGHPHQQIYNGLIAEISRRVESSARDSGRI